jgi:hypothetical protein
MAAMRRFRVFLIACALPASWPVGAMADCRCVANGQSFEQGETTCIRVSSGAYLAQCDKVLNNSSWKKLQDGCPDISSRDTGAKRPG